MNQAIARQMIAADLLKLRRHRPTMVTAALLSAGMAIVYFAFIEARHHGNLAGPQALSDGASLMGNYFGAFAAILIGAEAGTTDLSSSVFRDLVATGRSRTALFLVRIPAATAITLTSCSSSSTYLADLHRLLVTRRRRPEGVRLPGLGRDPHLGRLVRLDQEQPPRTSSRGRTPQVQGDSRPMMPRHLSDPMRAGATGEIQYTGSRSAPGFADGRVGLDRFGPLFAAAV